MLQSQSLPRQSQAKRVQRDVRRVSSYKVKKKVYLNQKPNHKNTIRKQYKDI